jgi:hypothetical protein
LLLQRNPNILNSLGMLPKIRDEFLELASAITWEKREMPSSEAREGSRLSKPWNCKLHRESRKQKC